MLTSNAEIPAESILPRVMETQSLAARLDQVSMALCKIDEGHPIQILVDGRPCQLSDSGREAITAAIYGDMLAHLKEIKAEIADRHEAGGETA